MRERCKKEGRRKMNTYRRLMAGLIWTLGTTSAMWVLIFIGL